jgi:hypothetical protein
MSEPRRLLEDSNPELRKVLASADRDRPSAASRERALGVLGIAGTASLAPLPGSSAAAGATKAAWAGVVKIVGIVTASGVMVAGAVHYLSPPAAPPAPAPVVVPAATTVEVPPVIPQPTETATIEPPPSATASVIPPKPKPPSVADELAVLDRATAALRDKNPKAALAALDDHDARFPKGAFGFQSDVLRIEALAQSGNMDAARARGHAFLTAHPNAPEAARVRSLIGE